MALKPYILKLVNVKDSGLLNMTTKQLIKNHQLKRKTPVSLFRSFNKSYKTKPLEVEKPSE